MIQKLLTSNFCCKKRDEKKRLKQNYQDTKSFLIQGTLKPEATKICQTIPCATIYNVQSQLKKRANVQISLATGVE